MFVIDATNVNEALPKGILHLLEAGVTEDSRNGKVLVAPTPVCTVYRKPLERVLFSPLRNANPFFHVMEALWMLGGHHDLKFPLEFNSRFAEYSDDGQSVFGAYGWRWREFFGYDQLEKIAYELQNNPQSRRCVLSMWNGWEIDEYEDEDAPLHSHCDLYVATHGGKDVPCNTHAYFDCRGGKLNMTVCNRSNDIIWGAYGANAVHFSFLQEYMALRIGVPVGVYRQVSNNFHAYLDVYDVQKLLMIANNALTTNYYATEVDFNRTPLFKDNCKRFEDELEYFLNDSLYEATSHEFIRTVAQPMRRAWELYKQAELEKAVELLYATMIPCDWRTAALTWLMLRKEAKNVKN